MAEQGAKSGRGGSGLVHTVLLGSGQSHSRLWAHQAQRRALRPLSGGCLLSPLFLCHGGCFAGGPWVTAACEKHGAPRSGVVFLQKF